MTDHNLDELLRMISASVVPQEKVFTCPRCHDAFRYYENTDASCPKCGLGVCTIPGCECGGYS